MSSTTASSKQRIVNAQNTDIRILNSIVPKISIPEIAEIAGISRQAVHKKLKEKNIETNLQGNSKYLNHTGAKEFFNFEFEKQVIAIQIVKGGVGKTTITQSLSTRCSLYGAKVLCIDIDQQANLTRSFNIDASEMPVMIDVLKGEAKFQDAIVSVTDGIDLVPSRMENANLDNVIMLNKLPLNKVYLKYIQKIIKNYDLVLFDCPPALGQSVAASTLASSMIIMPVTPELFSIDGLNVSTNELQNLKESYESDFDVKIILNKYDSRTKLSHEILGKLLSDPKYKSLLFNSFVSTNQLFANVVNEKATIFDSVKPNNAKIDIDLIVRELLDIELDKD